MNVEFPAAGKYIVAVSGGVDSVVLLDLLAARTELELVIGHVDHGMREDSPDDAKFVAELAGLYGVAYESIRLELGQSASEETARNARYNFLRQICKKYHAKAVITAHHQDDVLETMFINCLRGTGWRGLSSLRSHDETLRPLLHSSKRQIRDYAAEKRLAWHEDHTNTDEKYLRNYIRQRYIPQLSPQQREQLVARWQLQVGLSEAIGSEVEQVLKNAVVQRHPGSVELSRYWLTMVPYDVADELIRSVLLSIGSHAGVADQRRRLVYFARTARSGAITRPHNDYLCTATRGTLIVASAQT